MSKRELLALAAIVASAYGTTAYQSEQEVEESFMVALSDMEDECFIG